MEKDEDEDEDEEEEERLSQKSNNPTLKGGEHNQQNKQNAAFNARCLRQAS